jgi:hypothetical protein
MEYHSWYEPEPDRMCSSSPLPRRRAHFFEGIVITDLDASSSDEEDNLKDDDHDPDLTVSPAVLTHLKSSLTLPVPVPLSPPISQALVLYQPLVISGGAELVEKTQSTKRLEAVQPGPRPSGGDEFEDAMDVEE